MERISDFKFEISERRGDGEQVVNRVLVVWTICVPRCSSKVAGVLLPVLHSLVPPWNVHWCGVEHGLDDLFTSL